MLNKIPEDSEVINNIRENRFELSLGDKKAIIEYTLLKEENRIIFNHTEVPPEFSGQGIAGRLAKKAFDYAREENLRVTSFCSYIDSYIARHPELKDLL